VSDHSNIKWVVTADREQLAHKVVEAIVEQVSKTLTEQDNASLLLSGGSTPLPAYKLLAKANLPWDKLQISLTDERCVVDSDSSSNAAMLWQCLLSQHPQVNWFPLWKNEWQWQLGSQTPSIKALGEHMSALQKPLSLVLLGMGEDGHFASLFPGCEASQQSVQCKDKAEFVCTQAPSEPKRRVSWSLSALLQTQALCLYVTGTKKKVILDQVIAGDTKAQDYPIAQLLTQSPRPITIYWSE